MGHDTSRQRIADNVRMSSLAYYATWTLVTRCTPCDRETRTNLRRCAEAAPDALVGHVIDALRCAGCGHGPAFVAIEGQGRRAVIRGARSC